MTENAFNLSEKSKKTATPNYGLILLMAIALGFVVFLFWRLNQHKINLPSQIQPEPEATNSADFSQANASNSGNTVVVNKALELAGKVSLAEIKKMDLYGRDTCPHCQNVSEWLANEPEISALITKKWLNENADYLDEVTTAARTCQILDERGIGVPFLYVEAENLSAEERCLMGGDVITEFLTALKK